MSTFTSKLIGVPSILCGKEQPNGKRCGQKVSLSWAAAADTWVCSACFAEFEDPEPPPGWVTGTPIYATKLNNPWKTTKSTKKNFPFSPYIYTPYVPLQVTPTYTYTATEEVYTIDGQSIVIEP